LIKSYQKITSPTDFKDGYYYPQYSEKRAAILEEEFIERINKSQIKKRGSIDEHQLIDQFKLKANKTIDIIAANILCDREYIEKNNLLFYHWYERKYNKRVINKDILYTLNTSTITGWFDRFPKKDFGFNIFEKLESFFVSSQFPRFSIYYEYFYNFFPSIEKFSFNEFREKEFLNYLLELFPECIAINYKNQKRMWRLTDSQLEKTGDAEPHVNTVDRNNTHNAISYNSQNIPCFYPSLIGEKNNDMYMAGLTKKHSPLGLIESFILRNIENELRQENGLPKVGEGWISETLLYQKVKENFTKYNVLQHGKPKWLGLQHFDIYLPELNIAIEYQGAQHQKPIEYFGGKVAFEKNQERDKRKQLLCEQNNCLLFYVYPDDDVSIFMKKLESTIVNLTKKNKKNNARHAVIKHL